jgi:hypothetical protein
MKEVAMTRTTLPHERIGQFLDIKLVGRIPKMQGRTPSRNPSSADLLIEALRDRIELGTARREKKDWTRQALARLIDKPDHEPMWIDSREFRGYLTSLFYRLYGNTLPAAHRESVIYTLEGLALSGEEQIPSAPAVEEGQ